MLLRKYFLTALSILFLSTCCFLVSCGPDAEEDPEPEREQISLNELYSAGDDWVELYNDSDAAVNVGGYKIYDDETDKYTIPSGITIPAKGFLILDCDGTATGLHTNFKITSDGETIYLENASGKLIDKAELPALNNGQSYGRYPDGSGAFAVSGNTSKGTSNNDANAPAISEVARTPLVPSLSDNVTVTAKVVSSAAIGSVKVYFRFKDGAFAAVDMVASGSTYTGVIPAMNDVGEVEYFIEAKSSSGVISRHPAAADNFHDYLLNDDELPVLYINEFMALNVSCCPDVNSGVEEFDDWIEIYNPGDEAIQLAGMYLSDDKTNPFGTKIPDDQPALTLIPAKGYLVFWADEQKEQGPLHVNFKLSGSGEDVGLYYIDGRAIDVYTFGEQAEGKSYGRTTDGAVTWKQFASPTQGASNK